MNQNNLKRSKNTFTEKFKLFTNENKIWDKYFTLKYTKNRFQHGNLVLLKQTEPKGVNRMIPPSPCQSSDTTFPLPRFIQLGLGE